MKKTLFILITLITLVSCNKSNNPLETYAKENNIEIVDTIVQRDYCAIDSIRYYDTLILQKSNELAKKVKANPYISNDSIIKYRKYGITLPKEGKANSTAYYGIVKGTTKVVGIYVMDDGRIISHPLKTIFQHKACTDKLYADSFYKVQKNSHSSFEVICCRR